MQPVMSFISSIPADWFFILGLFLAAVIDTWRNGSVRVALVAAALPVALFFYSSASNALVLSAIVSAPSAVMQVVVLALCFALSYLALDRFLNPAGYDSNLAISALLAGLSCVAIVLGVWLHTPALLSAWHFGKSVTALFGGGLSFWWVVGGYGILVYMRS